MRDYKPSAISIAKQMNCDRQTPVVLHVLYNTTVI